MSTHASRKLGPHLWTGAQRLLRAALLIATALTIASPLPVCAQQAAPLAAQLISQSTADLPEIQRRGQLRVLVTPNRTNFFMTATGQFRGLEYDLATMLVRNLNRGRGKAEMKLGVLFVPVLTDELLPALLEGRGDIVAAGLTITPARQAKVAFTKPYLENIREVLVTRAGGVPAKSQEDLAGRDVHVVAGSSYAEHLETVRQNLLRKGLPAMRVVQADPVLESENLLEMLSAGMIENVVTDEHIALVWSKVLPGLAVQPQAAIAHGGRIAWAVRKNNPLLLDAVNKALGEMAHKQTALFRKNFPATLRDARWLDDPFGSPATAQLLPAFQQRSGEYGFDWLHILAQAFQESGLDNNARSRGGAVGVMQVLPTTGAALGFKDIRPAPHNIHAGVRYMGQMRDQEIGGGQLDEEQRFCFALAAYNAGPARLRKLRETARAEGLNPNLWFGNVERVAMRSGCQTTAAYVRNIRGYAIAYRLSYEIHTRKNRAGRH